MNKFSKILLLTTLAPLVACEPMTQSPAKVEYHLEDYYGYGDVQGPPVEGSKQDVAMRTNGVPVVIEDVSSNNTSQGYQPPAGIVEENMTQPGTQVYTVSDKVGPVPTEQPKLVMNPVSTDTSEVNISAKTHTVAQGETLFSISRQYDIPILPIIVANNLEQPYAVKVGQQIKIPEGKFHTVKEGETLYSISRQYGVDMSGITKLNSLASPNVVKGQRLQIPFPTDLPSEQTATVQEETVIPEPTSTTEYSKSTNTTTAGGPVSLSKPSGGILGSGQTVNNTSQVQQPVDTETENAKLAETTSAKIQETEAKAEPVKDAVVQDGKFMWPVKGKVVKKFGQQGADYNDGINISAAAGTVVKASNSGRVVYTGNSLKSYGNLIIIKHDNGLLSAYAHMNNVNVKKDQKISKGQSIGTVGSTGKVTSPQLYFAIRKGKEAKNPMNYLK